MKALLTLVFSLLSACCASADASGLREIRNFNREWKFSLGDKRGADKAAYHDVNWESVGLPHSFSLPYFAANDKFYVGYGWYRKHFSAPEKAGERRISLEFDGVFQVAELFVNGRRIGEHEGGYTGF